jgi:hypothetical protein
MRMIFNHRNRQNRHTAAAARVREASALLPPVGLVLPIEAGLRLTPAILPALLFLPFVLAPPLNHDAGAVLAFSERWLNGERLYSDLIDVNPPLIFVLNLIPAAIAKWTVLGGVQALQLCILAYGLLAWRLAVRVRDRLSEGAAERVFVDVLPALFLLAAGYDFGQREHLMAVGALPYLLCASRRCRGERPLGRIGAAVLAGIGFALKPHFLAIPVMTELAVIAGRASVGPARARFGAALRRSFIDPVPWAMGAVWAVYLVSLPLVFPDYVGTVLPLVSDYYVDLGGLSIWQMLLEPRLASVLLLVVPLLFVLVRARDAARNALPSMLGLGTLGALSAALAQHKGWSYHILPIELFACALGGLLACCWLDRTGASRMSPGPHRVAAVFTGLVALYAVLSGEAPWKEVGYAKDEVAGLTALLQREAAGERVLILSPGIYPIYPAVNYAHVQTTLRSMNVWLLQGAYRQCLDRGRRYREVWEMGRTEFFVYRTVAEDFAKASPAAVLVDRQPGIPWCDGEFDFLAYFARHPLFAEVWSHYRLAATWDRYRIYTRRD